MTIISTFISFYVLDTTIVGTNLTVDFKYGNNPCLYPVRSNAISEASRLSIVSWIFLSTSESNLHPRVSQLMSKFFFVTFVLAPTSVANLQGAP